MKQNNKPFGRLRLALLVLCAIILSITAVIAAGLFSAKNNGTANAYTSTNKSSFTMVNGGKEIFNTTENKFDSVGLYDLMQKIYGTTDFNTSAVKAGVYKASAFKTKDLLVTIGGQEWTPVYCGSDGRAPYIVFWLAESEELVTGSKSKAYGNSDMRKILTGKGSSTCTQSAKWALFENKLEQYFYESSNDVLGRYSTDNLWVCPSTCVASITGTNTSNMNPTTGGSYGVSNLQASNSTSTVLKVSDTENLNGGSVGYSKFYIYCMGVEGTTGVVPSEYVDSYISETKFALRPCFALDLTRAYESTEKVTPIVTPKISYTGKLYTSSKMPTISLSTGDTAGSIAWTATSLTAGTNDYGWKFTPSSNAYKSVTGTYKLTVEEVKFSSITTEFDSGTDIVYTNTPYDAIKNYIKIKGYNNDGTLTDLYTDGVIPADKYTLLGELKPGKNILKVLCEDGDIVGEVTIPTVQSAGNISYDSLEISVLPNVTVYKAFETLNTTGMKVNAVYTNGSKKEVTDYTVTYPDYDNNPSDCLHYGDTAVTISCEIDGVTHSTTVAVTVDYAKSKVTAKVDVNGTLYTSSAMPAVILSDGDTAGTIVWKQVLDANGGLVAPKLLAGENEYEWIFTPADANYESLSGSLKITAEEVALESITATYVAPVDSVTGDAKKLYTSTKLNDILGVTVIGRNNDGTLFTKFDPDGKIPAGEYKLAGTLVAGNSEITVTYGGKVFVLTLPDVSAVEIEELKAEYERDTIIYASYSSEKLKEGLTVTAVYNDGTEKVLNHYNLINNLSDKPATITIEYEGETLKFTPLDRNLKVAETSGIEVKFSPTGVIYTTATFDEIKKYITVTVHYNDGSKQENLTVEELETSLGGTFGLVAGVSDVNLSAGDGNAVAVAYTPADGSGVKYGTFTVNNVLPVELKGIEVEVSIPSGTEITTATDINGLKQYLKVSAIYNVGEPVIIADAQRITVIGSLVSPECTLAVVYEDAALGVKVSKDIKIGGVTQAKQKPKVTPQITVNGALVEGKELPAITLSLGDTAGSIAWKEVPDGQGGTTAPTLKAGTNKYYWTFTPNDGSLYEELNAEDCVYYLTAEAVKANKLTIQRIESAGVIYDNISFEELKTKFKVVVGYNDGRADTEIAPDDYEISAVLKSGVSNVLFSFVDEKGNVITATTQVSVLSGDIKFVDLLWDGGREFEYSGKAQNPTAYFVQNGEMIMYGKDNIKIYRMGANGEYDIEVEEAVFAGSYKLVAENADKYTVRSGGDFTFKINPKTITRPTAISTTGYVYNGQEQEFLLDGFDESKMEVVGNKQSEVGKHMVTVKITDSNYTFAVGSGTSDELKFEFNIQTASSVGDIGGTTPNVTVEGNGISTGLAIAIAVAVVLVLIISVVAIIIALRNKGSSDNDGFYDTVE